MKETLTRNQSGRTSSKTLFSMTPEQIQDHFIDGRINQSEFDLYIHFWNRDQKNPCACGFCLIEQGKSEKLYRWLQGIGYNAAFDFFCALGWPEGYHYCMSNKMYYDLTGFIGLKNDMRRMLAGEFVEYQKKEK